MRIKPEIVEQPEATAPMLRGLVRFDRVSFVCAHGRPALDDISLTIPPGSKTGFD